MDLSSKAFVAMRAPYLSEVNTANKTERAGNKSPASTGSHTEEGSSSESKCKLEPLHRCQRNWTDDDKADAQPDRLRRVAGNADTTVKRSHKVAEGHGLASERQRALISIIELTTTSILDIFNNKTAWETNYYDALESSQKHRKRLLSRLAYLSVLKSTTLPQLRVRSHMIGSEIWKISPQVFDNHRAWMRYWLHMPVDMVDKVVKHVNWLKLLEDEYKKIEPVWREFWSFANSHAGMPRTALRFLQELTQSHVLEQLESHNKKRLFLQSRILEGTEFLAVFCREPPAWLAWSSAKNDDDSDVEEVGTGFVEELEKGEESEEFEL